MSERLPASERADGLFRALVREELSPDSPEAREVFAQDPDLLARWEAFDRDTAHLDAAGRLAREVIADEEDSVADDWDQLVFRVVRPEDSSTRVRWAGGPRALLPSLPVLIALAAAAALLLLLPRWMGDEDVTPVSVREPMFLGNPAERPILDRSLEVSPASEPLVFRWRYTPPENWTGYCQVMLYGKDFTELDTSPPQLSATSEDVWTWTPGEPVQELMRQQGELIWRVTAFAPNGEPLVSSPASVSLR